MARGDTTDNAAKLLHELHAYWRQHPVTGPDGHSVVSSEPRPTRVAPSLPFNAGVVDHITASVREVVDHTLAANPTAGPIPQRIQDTYAWMHENTENAPEADRFRAEVIEYRQYLEHSIRIGNVKVVRPHRCPKCATFSLMWPRGGKPETHKAQCTNMECVDRDGYSTQVSLARIAHQYVTKQWEKKSSVG